MTDTRSCRKCKRPMVPQRQPVPEGAVEHDARGLCTVCYHWARSNGLLDEFPKLQRSAASVAEDHNFLARQGLDRDQIAERLWMKRRSLERALCRHRARTRPDGRTNDSLAVAS